MEIVSEAKEHDLRAFGRIKSCSGIVLNPRTGFVHRWWQARNQGKLPDEKEDPYESLKRFGKTVLEMLEKEVGQDNVVHVRLQRDIRDAEQHLASLEKKLGESRSKESKFQEELEKLKEKVRKWEQKPEEKMSNDDHRRLADHKKKIKTWEISADKRRREGLEDDIVNIQIPAAKAQVEKKVQETIQRARERIGDDPTASNTVLILLEMHYHIIRCFRCFAAHPSCGNETQQFLPIASCPLGQRHARLYLDTVVCFFRCIIRLVKRYPQLGIWEPSDEVAEKQGLVFLDDAAAKCCNLWRDQCADDVRAIKSSDSAYMTDDVLRYSYKTNHELVKAIEQFVRPPEGGGSEGNFLQDPHNLPAVLGQLHRKLVIASNENNNEVYHMKDWAWHLHLAEEMLQWRLGLPDWLRAQTTVVLCADPEEHLLRPRELRAWVSHNLEPIPRPRMTPKQILPTLEAELAEANVLCDQEFVEEAIMRPKIGGRSRPVIDHQTDSFLTQKCKLGNDIVQALNQLGVLRFEWLWELNDDDLREAGVRQIQRNTFKRELEQAAKIPEETEQAKPTSEFAASDPAPGRTTSSGFIIDSEVDTFLRKHADASDDVISKLKEDGVTDMSVLLQDVPEDILRDVGLRKLQIRKLLHEISAAREQRAESPKRTFETKTGMGNSGSSSAQDRANTYNATSLCPPANGNLSTALEIRHILGRGMQDLIASDPEMIAMGTKFGAAMEVRMLPSVQCDDAFIAEHGNDISSGLEQAFNVPGRRLGTFCSVPEGKLRAGSLIATVEGSLLGVLAARHMLFSTGDQPESTNNAGKEESKEENNLVTLDLAELGNTQFVCAHMSALWIRGNDQHSWNVSGEAAEYVHTLADDLGWNFSRSYRTPMPSAKLGMEMMAAISNHNFDQVKQSLDMGAPVDFHDAAGRSPLHLAALSSCPEQILQLLLSFGAPLFSEDRQGNTPLHSLLQGSRPFQSCAELSSVLVLAGALPYSFNAAGRSPLHSAATLPIRYLESLLKVPCLHLDLCDAMGYTPLHNAALGGEHETVALLLKHGACMSNETHDGKTPMNVALEAGHAEVADFLQTRSHDNKEGYSSAVNMDVLDPGLVAAFGLDNLPHPVEHTNAESTQIHAKYQTSGYVSMTAPLKATRGGSNFCVHQKNQESQAAGASSSSVGAEQPAGGICQGIYKTTKQKCTTRARAGSNFCGRHKNQESQAAGASSSSGGGERPAAADGICQGINKTTKQKCTTRARAGSNFCGRHKNQESQAAGASSSSGGARPASSSSPTIDNSATSVDIGAVSPLDQFWKHEFSKDVKQKCQEFLINQCTYEFRENGDGGELGVWDMKELILKRRAVAGLAQHSQNPPNFRNDPDLLMALSPFNLLTKSELEQMLKLLGLKANTKSTKRSMLRDLVYRLAALDELPATVQKVELSGEGEEFRKKMFEDVCLDNQGGLLHLLNPALATNVVIDLLQWAKEDTYILTQESIEIVQGRQIWLKDMDGVLKGLEEGNGMPEGSMDTAREAVKKVKRQVQWELDTASDCEAALHDALVSHHTEQILRFYKQETAPMFNGGGISSERKVNFFAGKHFNKHVLRAPQQEALDAVARWVEGSARLLNGEFATQMRKLLGEQMDALMKLKGEFCCQVRNSYFARSTGQALTDQPVLSALEHLKDVTSRLREHRLNENKPAILVLPAGFEKTEVITGLPFVLPLRHSRRVLVVAPNRGVAEGLMKDFADPKESFYVARKLLPSGSDLPKTIALSHYGDIADPEKLKHYDVVTGFYQQFSKKLLNFPRDFFDAVVLVFYDEGHRYPQTYMRIREYFPSAYMVTLTTTPWRRDRQELVGDEIYTFPIEKAIENDDDPDEDGALHQGNAVEAHRHGDDNCCF